MSCDAGWSRSIAGQLSMMLAIVLFSAAAAVAGVTSGMVSMPQPAATSPRSVKDGVYSEAQAARGDALSQRECASCHARTLVGGEFGPSLVGGDFKDRWNGMTLSDLYELTRTEMPQDSPGRLNRGEYADIIAYVLKLNGYPAGNTELPAALEVLGKIRVEK